MTRRRSATTPLRAYRRSDLRARTHTALRWASAPLRSVAALLPEDGEILDLGCGHGVVSLHLALEGPRRRVHGVDVDADKVAVARVAARELRPSAPLRFDPVPPGWRPSAERYDGVLVCDVLYLLEPLAAAETLAAAARAVRPGGRIVVKEMAQRPRWKRHLLLTQEQLSVRLLRLTAGERVRPVPEQDIWATLSAAGLTVQRHDLSRGYPHPHVAWVGTKRGTPHPP